MKIKNLLIAPAALFLPFCCLAKEQISGSKPVEITHPSDFETLIAFLPAIFFLLILIITTIKLRNDKVKLSDLLAEKDPAMPAKTTDATVPQQSVSRFIAFLTGLVALTISICITTFYIYAYFGFNKPDPKIDISSLTNVIWGLGIGVIPYGANKVSSALKP